MILVFDTLQEAIDCEEQITSITRDLYASEGYNIINGEVEIMAGKQRIERWAIPSKAFNVDKWYFQSPQERSPDYFTDMVAGFAYEELSDVPSDWIDSGDI